MVMENTADTTQLLWCLYWIMAQEALANVGIKVWTELAPGLIAGFYPHICVSAMLP